MIDPLSAVLATRSGVGLVGRLMGAELSASAPKSSPSSLKAEEITDSFELTGTDVAEDRKAFSFESLLTQARKKAIERLFDAHPELKTKLGEGPYSVSTAADGSLTLSSSSTGRSISLNPDTALGQQAKALLTGLKSTQKFKDILQNKTNETDDTKDSGIKQDEKWEKFGSTLENLNSRISSLREEIRNAVQEYERKG